MNTTPGYVRTHDYAYLSYETDIIIWGDNCTSFDRARPRRYSSYTGQREIHECVDDVLVRTWKRTDWDVRLSADQWETISNRHHYQRSKIAGQYTCLP